MGFSKDQRAAAITDFWQRQDGSIACPGCQRLIEAVYVIQSNTYLLAATCPMGCGTLNMYSGLDDPLYPTFRDWTPEEQEQLASIFSAAEFASCPVDRSDLVGEWSRRNTGSWLLLHCGRCCRNCSKEFRNRK
jgi:uncharacterized radical SAM superfamily Fe-S cluster-containing enzyme